MEDVGEQGRNSLSVLMGNLKLVIFAMLIFPHLALKETTVVARMWLSLEQGFVAQRFSVPLPTLQATRRKIFSDALQLQTPGLRAFTGKWFLIEDVNCSSTAGRIFEHSNL